MIYIDMQDKIIDRWTERVTGKRFDELTARVHGRDKEIVSNFG